jgi:hypothetical protein
VSAQLRRVELGSRFAGGAADLSLWLVLGIYGAVVVAVRQSLSRALALNGRASAQCTAFADGVAWGDAAAGLALAVLLAPSGTPPPFIYFQF